MFSTDQSVKVLQTYGKKFPDTVLVLGSGWNKIVDEMTVDLEISFQDLFGVSASVPGHQGKLLIGSIQKKRVACMSGRLHMYEGYSGYDATAPYRLFGKMGVKTIILTAACGALNEKYKVGDFVVLSDMITLLLAIDSPLRGPQFIDVSEVFDRDLRQKAISICSSRAIQFHEGVYAYYHGPNYETPADKMALRFLGADVCGMSTVPETLVARSLGMRVLGLSFVTNLAFVKHSHQEVVAEANKASEQMKILLSSII
jgi:purine-nucleoside phosphorylase